jgi:cytochrome c553
MATRFSSADLCLQCHVSHGNETHAVSGLRQIAIGSCGICHSPDGAYDGVNDPQLGALNNLDALESTIYDANGYLKPGKEAWCLTCHDDGHSNIQV